MRYNTQAVKKPTVRGIMAEDHHLVVIVLNHRII